MCLFKRRKRREAILRLDDRSLDIEIRIRGTKFDRQRKFRDDQINAMRKLYKNHWSISAIAEVFDTVPHVVKCYVVSGYRDSYNEKRKGKYPEKRSSYNRLLDMHERASYKRTLVENKKLKVK